MYCRPVGSAKRLSRDRLLPVVLLLLPCAAWGCHPRSVWRDMPFSKAWRVEKGLKKVRLEILEAEGLEMEEAALYHLTVAKGLLRAAEKQYEDADFAAASRFLNASEEQLDRARTLRGLSCPGPDPLPGGPG